MSHALKLKSSIMFAVLLLPLAQAQAAAIGKDAYQTGKARISVDYKTDTTNCAALQSNARDICNEEAKAKEKVAKAELEYSYTGKPADARKLQVVMADTAYAVAKERCDDQSGNAKDVCVKEAKAVKAKALADVTLQKKVSEAGADAADTKREADYKVAAEKCDAAAGDLKTSCLASARAKYGKM